VTIQYYDENGALGQPFFPDADALFELPYDARQYLLALICDELVLATESRCSWLSQDVFELRQQARKAHDQRRRFMIVPVDDEDE
jgi:hypothetical protein